MTDVFVTSGAAAAVTGVSLEDYCRAAWGAVQNARDQSAWETANPDEVAAGEDPPSIIFTVPGVDPDPDADTRACSGMSARLIANPPGEPCPYGHGKALAGYYAYNVSIQAFEWFGSDEWTAARAAGGDSGVWDTAYVCLELFAGLDDAASFAEIVLEPDFAKSPHVTGLAGLETWVWHDFTAPESRVITRDFVIDADGLPLGLTATIWVDQVRWDLDGDGSWDVVADPPDTDTEPASPSQYLQAGGSDDENLNAGTFTYLRKDLYSVTVQIEWRGTYEFVNYPGNTGFYDPLVVSTTEDYRVCELIGVLAVDSAGPDNTACTAP